MARMTGPDCAVMCNLINTHIHINTHTVYYSSTGNSKQSYINIIVLALPVALARDFFLPLQPKTAAK